MLAPVWISRDTLVAIHDTLIEEFGGIPGIRDENFLEAVISRPRHLYVRGEGDVCIIAAAYSLAIARNSPFMDGNRRTAFMAAYVFLRTNGRELIAENLQSAEIIMDLAAGEMSELEFAQWLREHLELE